LGFTRTIVEVANAERPDLKGDVELLVDSGASYSIIGGDFLGKLQVQPLGEREFTLANGERIRRKVSGVRIRVGDRVGFCSVIFGEEHDQPVLGVTALEELGLELDPTTKQLRPAELFLL
jgi:aspartyl protease family protein